MRYTEYFLCPETHGFQFEGGGIDGWWPWVRPLWLSGFNNYKNEKKTIYHHANKIELLYIPTCMMAQCVRVVLECVLTC